MFRRVIGSKQENPFHGLRRQALSVSPETAGYTPTEPAHQVYGAILDWGLESGALATIVALEDGTASLYLSSGGGIIGGGFHEPVRQAVAAFLHSIEQHIADMEPDPTGEPPQAGSTDLRALTPAGRLVIRAPTDSFGSGRHLMSEAFFAGQALIGALRQATEGDGR
jgi:hypothetical protein